jgi:hypothetical protein
VSGEPAWLAKLHPSLRPLALEPRRADADVTPLRVIVRFTGPPEHLGPLGLTVTAVAGDVAVGLLQPALLPRLGAAPQVLAIEPSRPMRLAP